MWTVLYIMLVVGLGGAFRETARRRGGKAWPFGTAAVLGYFFLVPLAWGFLVGTSSLAADAHAFGIAPFLTWGWVGICYLSMFILLGGGRRAREAWQCPGCTLWNEATTLVCGCGHRLAETAVLGT